MNLTTNNKTGSAVGTNEKGGVASIGEQTRKGKDGEELIQQLWTLDTYQQENEKGGTRSEGRDNKTTKNSCKMDQRPRPSQTNIGPFAALEHLMEEVMHG